MVGFDHDDLVSKAGGGFRFVSLIQRRMRELQRGAAPFVEGKGTALDTAIAEFRSGKIWLALGEEADALREERTKSATGAAPPEPKAKALPPPAAKDKTE